MCMMNTQIKPPDYADLNVAELVTKTRKSNKNRRIVVSLTCLQFLFVVYVTSLLFLLSPTVDPITENKDSWRSQLKQWYGFVSFPRSMSARDQLEQTSAFSSLTPQAVCEYEKIEFEQKKSNDTKMLTMKRELFNEIMQFQQLTRGTETLKELMALPSIWQERGAHPKITVILNHFRRKTLCAQLDALKEQTNPFHKIWVLAFGSPAEDRFRQIVKSYNDSRITFISSSHDFKYYGRFQVALQSDGADYVYIVDDDMIPGRKMLHILSHIAGTQKYRNTVLGSIGRILPFRQKDFTFPSYRKFGSREAGLYLPDPAYNITVNQIVQVDFLSSSWFLSAELVKTIFIETPVTFATGEDLHLSYQLQKYRDAGSFVVPIDPDDKDTWGDGEHRLAQISETTVIFKDVVEMRDDQWWRAFSRGYVTQWARMYPQQIDALLYAHTLEDVTSLAPLIRQFRVTPNRKAYLVISGGALCPCQAAVMILGWPASVCYERRFKVFDLELGSISKSLSSNTSIIQEIHASMKGLIKIHSPALVIAVGEVETRVRDALSLVVSQYGMNTSLALLPRDSIPHSLWIPSVRSQALQSWNKMQISVNIITQNRAKSLERLLRSINTAYYVGDKITLTFNMDSRVDDETLRAIHEFTWPHGRKILRRRIIQGGLIRAVSESWYPASDNEFGLLLEDDIEVSPFYYLWIKYALLAYHYDPFVSLPELSAISLYTPRLIEVVKERPKWNATDFFKQVHPNMPYLHQLPCSWGSLFFPKHWREFFTYVGMRYTEDAKLNAVQIPKSRTNGWQASWKKFLIDMMYLRGYVSLYPNFPQQASFSTNHMEPGAHINASDNVLQHSKEDFEVPLMEQDFWELLPQKKLPPASRLPVLNLFNQPTSLKALRSAGATLKQDVLECEDGETVTVDSVTGSPVKCMKIS
ncbi:hypothetical protein KP509_11G071200 [Ceratopteris richardii]|uniref:Uncharacterized protein n=1 Tax=Ceratopteris richardii TaxID=49495 RepID=A0A8T2TQX9_CERRI|nr:hypothetical protein KP509_11G071200 [Ceratopteris richardii]KAH7425788.1 hypothetical protein KP509_11G071200 [Ceratopteris richardii]